MTFLIPADDPMPILEWHATPPAKWRALDPSGGFYEIASLSGQRAQCWHCTVDGGYRAVGASEHQNTNMARASAQIDCETRIKAALRLARNYAQFLADT